MDVAESLTAIGNLACIVGSNIGSAEAVAGTLFGVSLSQVFNVQELAKGLVGNTLYDVLKSGSAFARSRRGALAQFPPEFSSDLRGAFHQAIQWAIYDIGGTTCYQAAWKDGKRNTVPPHVDFFSGAQGRAVDVEAVREILERLRVDAEQSQIFPAAFTTDQQDATIAEYMQAKTPDALNAAFYDQMILPRLTTASRFRTPLPPQLDTHLRRHLFDRILVHLPETLAQCPDAWEAFNRVLLKDTVAILQQFASPQGQVLTRLDTLAESLSADNVRKVITEIIGAMGQTPKEPGDDLKTFMERVVREHSEIQTKLDALQQSMLARFDALPDQVVAAIERFIRPQRDRATILADAQKLLASMPTTEAVPVRTLPPPSVMPLSRNHLFTGREEQLRTIAKALKGQETVAIEPASSTNDNQRVSTAAATGMGGIGKSQLACEFVHRYGHYFAGGVFWLSFADAAAVPSEIAACGGAGALELSENFSALPLDDQVRMVRAAWNDSIPRLLVFDNCEDTALLQAYQPTSGGCRVLITSRRADWAHTMNVTSLALETLSLEDSIVFLRKLRPDLAADDADLVAIATELDGLPLALHLAGSVLSNPAYRSTLTPAKYLAEIRKPDVLERRHWLGNDELPSPTKHDMHVARTFAISYDLLKQDDPTDAQALALLARAAYFAPGEPIPETLLLATLGLPEDDLNAELEARDGLQRLVNLGLLEREEGGALSLHRLLGVFVRSRLTDGEAQASVEGAIDRLAGEVNRSGFPARLLAVQAHLRAITDNASKRGDEVAARLCHRLGFHLQAIGDYAGARPYYERALAIREAVLGAEHPDTALSLNNLGGLLDSQGDYAGARPYYERALQIREAVLGAKHTDTAGSLNNLGFLLQGQGDYAGARPYYERALAIYEAVLGAEHPGTAMSLNNLGGLLQAQGDYAGARPYYERALRIFETRLGSEHPYTQGVQRNIAALDAPRLSSDRQTAEVIRREKKVERKGSDRLTLAGRLRQMIERLRGA